MNTVLVRNEQPEDAEAIRRVLVAAFDRSGEADLVEALRRNQKLIASLVALVEGEVVGQVAFSAVQIDTSGASFEAAGLAPVAVSPVWQRRGIGSRLVRAGLEACRQAGRNVVVVLGDAAFYARFGFVPARHLGIRWEHDAPDEAFQVAELQDGALAGRGGVARYQPEFADV